MVCVCDESALSSCVWGGGGGVRTEATVRKREKSDWMDGTAAFNSRTIVS